MKPVNWIVLLVAALVPGWIQAAPPTPLLTTDKVRAVVPEWEKHIVQIREKSGVPGMVVGVVFQDQVLYLQGFGVREMGKPETVDPDTVFPLASVSKPVSTTILASLVGDKLIRWDDPVINHDSSFRLHDPWVTRNTTFADLLSHRSGLPDHAGDVLEDIGFGRGEILSRLRFVHAAYPFRAGYAYTNYGFTAAAVAGAKAAGKSWEDLCEEKLIRPLGMASTQVRHARFQARPNRVRLHAKVDGKFQAKFSRDPDAQAPAGGFSSSGKDLVKWLRLQLEGGKFDGRQLVSPNALADTHRPQVIPHPPVDPDRQRAGFYALGWNVRYDDQGRIFLNHSGGFDLGAATVVSLLPAERLGILVLTNGAPEGIPEAVAAAFMDQVLEGKPGRDYLELFGKLFAEMRETKKDYSKKLASASPRRESAAYVGTYQNDFYGPAAVVEKGGHLALVVGPARKSYQLNHWDRDAFWYQPDGEMASGPTSVLFRLGPDGRADSIWIDHMSLDGPFRRAND